jgi:hypothetical protein
MGFVLYKFIAALAAMQGVILKVQQLTERIIYFSPMR